MVIKHFFSENVQIKLRVCITEIHYKAAKKFVVILQLSCNSNWKYFNLLFQIDTQGINK